MSEHTIAAFVLGERFLVNETSQKIIRMFSGDDGQTVDVHDISSAIDEIVNPPFFGRKSIVLDVTSVSKDDVCALKEVYDLSTESCLLVVKGGSMTSPAKNEIKSAGESRMRLFDYSKKPSFADSVSFVQKRVVDRGGTISRDVASLLVSISGGGGYWSIAQEVDKIMSVSKDITKKHVAHLSFPSDNAQYYRLFTSIRDGNASDAIAELDALVSSYGYEAVDQTLFRLMSTAVRNASTSFTACIDIGRGRLNEHRWWPDGRKSGDPHPSSFMVEISDAIVARHGENGVKSILRFMHDDLCGVRIFPDTRHVLRLEMKIIAMCGSDGSPDITG